MPPKKYKNDSDLLDAQKVSKKEKVAELQKNFQADSKPEPVGNNSEVHTGTTLKQIADTLEQNQTEIQSRVDQRKAQRLASAHKAIQGVTIRDRKDSLLGAERPVKAQYLQGQEMSYTVTDSTKPNSDEPKADATKAKKDDAKPAKPAAKKAEIKRSTAKLNAVADLKTYPKDVVFLGEEDPQVSQFTVTHGKSGENDINFVNNFEFLSVAMAGDIIAGDFNSDFLDNKKPEGYVGNKRTNAAGKEVVGQIDDNRAFDSIIANLEKNNLRMEMTPESIDALKVMIKRRTGSSIFSQQLFKNGELNFAIKGLIFKVVDRKAGEPIIPVALETKINALRITCKKIKDLIEQSGDQSDEAVAKIIKPYAKDAVFYSDIDNSYGLDHSLQSLYDAASDTLFVAQNKINYEDYKIKEHFKADFIMDNDVTEKVYKAYAALDQLVYTEFYKLICLRDNLPADPLPADIQKAVADRIAFSKQIGNLTPEQMEAFFTAIFNSKGKEVEAINEMLVRPFDLTPEGQKALIANLVSAQPIPDLDENKKQKIDKDGNLIFKKSNLECYTQNNGVTNLVNAIYQGFNPQRPGKEDKVLSLNGTGFPAFKKNGKVLSEKEVHAIQNTYITESIKQLRPNKKTTLVSSAIIEATNQDDDVNAIGALLIAINHDAKIARAEAVKSSTTAATTSAAATSTAATTGTVSTNTPPDGTTAGTNTPAPTPSSNKTPEASKSNYSFLFKMGMAFSALTAIASIVVVALALTAVISMPPVAIGIVGAVGAAAVLALTFGFFKRPTQEKPADEPVLQDAPAPVAV